MLASIRRMAQTSLNTSTHTPPKIKRSGVEVPKEFIRRADIDDVAINIGGGGFPIFLTIDIKATDQVIIATTDTVSRYHIISNTASPIRASSRAADRMHQRGSLTHLMI